MAVTAGLEPAISGETVRCLSQLDHVTVLVTPVGFEPYVSGFRDRRLDQLDYGAMKNLRRDLNSHLWVLSI